MATSSTTRLEDGQRAAYRRDGYHLPLRAFAESDAAGCHDKFSAYWNANREELRKLLPREWRLLLTETHLFLRWVYDIVTLPSVLDAVESVLGPNVMVWNTHWFPKFPHDEAYVSWHQDATYWGLSPPNVTTAWIALTPSMPANGCMRVMPGSHNGELLPQRETYARDNMLSRGQEIAVDVDESKAVDLVLRPGEFSLHHVGIAHGSGANRSDVPRIGLAVRYISPDVVQRGSDRDLVMLVRGKDELGHFELVEPPLADMAYGESEAHREALARKARNISKN